MKSNLIYSHLIVSFGVLLSPFLRHSFKTIDNSFERQTKQQAWAVIGACSKVHSSVYPVDHRCSVDADSFIRFPVWTEIF